MTTKFVQPGEVVDWINGTGGAKTAGSVIVIGQRLGVALVDIANGATGSVQVRGVFSVPKVSGAVIADGESLVWDVSAGAFDDNLAVAASGDISGPTACAVGAAGNGVTVMNVDFTGVPGTKTA